MSLTCKIHFKFILLVVFSKKCKQVGSLCSVLEQNLLLIVIGCLGFTLLGNHKCFCTRLCHFQCNLQQIRKVDLICSSVSLIFNLIFTHNRKRERERLAFKDSNLLAFGLSRLCLELDLLIPKLVQRTTKESHAVCQFSVLESH